MIMLNVPFLVKGPSDPFVLLKHFFELLSGTGLVLFSCSGHPSFKEGSRDHHSRHEILADRVLDFSMKLPNRKKAIVRRSKIEDYLLSATHPHGRHKAKFFNKYGFFQDSWEALASALLKHADELEVAGV